jgi:DNA-binding Lrp family transcriptional regulator
MDRINQGLVKLLQGDLPFEQNPYEAIGEKLGIPEEEVIKRLRSMRDSNQLKRIGAVLRHQKSGYTSNAMAAFKVEEPMMEAIGTELASSPLVSHCYERAAHEKWPYNLYAMLHSRKEDEIEAFVRSVVKKYEIGAYEILYSVKELKKASMVYFD